MKSNKIFWWSLVGVILFAVVVLFLYIKFNNISFLTFSDAAKSADIARNIVLNQGFKGNFSFWSSSLLDMAQKAAFSNPWLPPLMPFSIALAFIMFGVSDFSVIGTSAVFFVGLVFFVFLLGRKIYGNLVGFLSAVAVASSPDFLNYASNGSSEILFTFEIIAAFYFVSLKKKGASVLAVLFGILMYFTRPQGFIYIAGLILYWLLLNQKRKKAFIVFTFVLIGGFLVDYFVLPSVSGKYFLYSVSARGIGTATQVTAGGSASDSLRGLAEPIIGSTTLVFVKKLFYNLYNFYKLLPQILNPYLFALASIGIIFPWSKVLINRQKEENSFKIATVFVFFLTLVVTAASIPFFRYLHPTVPFIYILAVGTLVGIISKTEIFKNKKLFTTLFSVLFIFLFSVGQILGMIFLDSRYVKNTHNVTKPPTYVLLSNTLKDNTSSDDLIITNLDTWGSWYGERKTIWYPYNPDQLVSGTEKASTFDAIYLTSYLINDQNYFMGKEWRDIYESPTIIQNKWISQNYKLKAVYTFSAPETYENIEARAVLLVRR